MPFLRETAFTFPSIDGISLDALVQAPESTRGSMLLAHGFSVDYHEEGAFDRLAEGLVAAEFTVLRFSFRGHGASGGTQEGMTISGERLDLFAAYRWMTGNLPGPFGLLGASFGGVATTLQLGALRPAPRCFVLWNPALEISGAKGADIETTRAQGYWQARPSFRVGQVFIEERALYPGNLAVNNIDGSIPTLILHGTNDELVPIASSRNAAAAPGVELVELDGFAHGFHTPHEEAEAVRITVAWIQGAILP